MDRQKSIAINFNPRSHKGSDAASLYPCATSPLFQSTLPQGERPRHRYVSAFFRLISIHAPTRGATYMPLQQEEPKTISIHAPTRGATNGQINTDGCLPNFNPRSHKGSDFDRIPSCVLHFPISIHAPTRGATFCRPCNRRLCGHFNPRSHKGSDYNPIENYDRNEISIHAPTRGATF